MANPILKGKVCLRKRNSPYNQSLVADQLVLNGELATREWLRGMLSNVSQPFYPGDIGITRAVAQGICGVGIVNHYYVSRMLAGVNGINDKKLAKKVKVITPNPSHVNVSAGGIATPADAALLMQIGVEGIFVGSGIFKSGNPAKMADAIVQATTHYEDAELIAEISKNLGGAMKGDEVSKIDPSERLEKRGW